MILLPSSIFVSTAKSAISVYSFGLLFKIASMISDTIKKIKVIASITREKIPVQLLTIAEMAIDLVAMAVTVAETTVDAVLTISPAKP